MAAATPSVFLELEALPRDEEKEATMDWTELPHDALLAVLHRLDSRDVLMGAGQVCGTWRRAAQDEPELWERVEVRPRGEGPSNSISVLCGLARAAVRRSAGRCQAFCGERAVNDSVLSLLADVAPSLKSLRIISGDVIGDKRLKLTVTKFTMLEELSLSLCTGPYPGTCGAVGTACPLLKRLRLNRNQFSEWTIENLNGEARAIATMRGLRSLQLFANPLSNLGLSAILDGCARLESLDIRHCFNVEMGGDAIRARRPGIAKLRLPRDTTVEYDLDYSLLDCSFDAMPSPYNTQDGY